MYQVHVQDAEGRPLDPTTRFGWVNRMLDRGKAVVVQRKPFTIRLTYRMMDPKTKLYLGSTDPGRTNIGNAVIETGSGAVVYTDKVQTRNREIPKLMAKRQQMRQASRRGERQARKRRAKKQGTLSTKLDNGRLIPGCKERVPVKDIINTESRFRNRKRHSNMQDVITTDCGWLTPTVKQLVQTHLNHIDRLCRLYPVTGWCLEANRFAFMRMEDGTVQGIDFQNGKLKGYDSVEAYVYALQDGRCAVCGQPLTDIHHIIPRHENGSDGPENRIGLCRTCHHKIHTGELEIEQVGKEQKYGALSALNQAIPYIYLGLVERFGEENVFLCSGEETAAARALYGLSKDHDRDAIAIAAAAAGIEPFTGPEEHFQVCQFRRQDRARIKYQRERTYKLDGQTVAKNRRPREEQNGPALSQWFEEQIRTAGYALAKAQRSRLTVTGSKRSYNNPDRILPGMTFLYEGIRYVMRGQLSGGRYYLAVDQGDRRFPAKKCRILTHNTGFVYV